MLGGSSSPSVSLHLLGEVPVTCQLTTITRQTQHLTDVLQIMSRQYFLNCSLCLHCFPREQVPHREPHPYSRSKGQSHASHNQPDTCSSHYTSVAQGLRPLSRHSQLHKKMNQQPRTPASAGVSQDGASLPLLSRSPLHTQSLLPGQGAKFSHTHTHQ